MLRAAFWVTVILSVTCGPSPNARLPGYRETTGGALGPSTGGTTGTGGVAETGGSKAPATGGRDGTGGIVASGGVATGGSVSSGGVHATGGGASTGGMTTTGGTKSTGGTPAIDGGSSPSIDGGNCISKVINNGYACGSAPACSACKDNDTSLEDKCQTVLKCFESKYPCTGNCATECFNSSGASGPVQSCVSALQSAACGGAGGC